MSTKIAFVVLALLALTGAPSAQADGATETPEFTLDATRGVVGSFDGFGGQLNQHLYAKISGPPAHLADVEAKVVSLEPQLVRIFFNTSAWESPDRLDSFVQTVRLADRAKAEINITWQGSTFAFAMRNMDRFADLLSKLLADGSIERMWVTMFNEPNTTQRTLPSTSRSTGCSIANCRPAACATASGSWAATSSAPPPVRRRPSGSATWPRTWATCSTHGRCTCTGTSGSPTRSTTDSCARCGRSSARSALLNGARCTSPSSECAASRASTESEASSPATGPTEHRCRPRTVRRSSRRGSTSGPRRSATAEP